MTRFSASLSAMGCEAIRTLRFSPVMPSGSFFVLLGAQVRQQVGDAKYRVVLVLADAHLHLAAIGAADHAVQRQRDGRPLVLAHAAVIVGAQVAKALFFKHRHRAQVQPGRIDVRDVQVEALLQRLGADGRGQHALMAVDGVHLGAGFQFLARHKGAVPGVQQQLFAVGGRLALGLGIVQEGFVPLAEFLRGRQSFGRRVGHGLIFVQKCFELFGRLHR